MLQIEDILIIIGVALIADFLIEYVFQKIKGKKVKEVFTSTDTIIESLQAITKSIKTITPTRVYNILTIIEKYSQIAVHAAEQLYQDQKLQPADRKSHAEKIVYIVLEQLGIEVTEDIKAIVNGAIEAEVLQLKSIKN